MADTQTSKEYTGDGNNNKAFSFHSYQESDVKVSVDGVVKSPVTHYNITSYSTTGGGTVVFTADNIPTSPAIIRIYRETDVATGSTGEEDPKAEYTAGSSIKAADLNNNQKQLLMAAYELQDQEIQETKIRDSAVTSAKIKDGAIVNVDINASAEIEVSKLKDGTARQLLQTDSDGTGVEWTSNVDVPGTLDVTGAADFDSTVNVDGTATLATVDINAGAIDGTTIGGSSAAAGTFTTGTIATADINGGAIDGTTIGASSAAAGTFTTGTIATADINGGNIDGTTIGANSAAAGTFTTINASGTITGDVTGDLTGDVTGDVTGNVSGNAGTATDLAAATKITNSEQAAHTVNDTTYFTTAATEARYFNVSTGETIKDGDTFPDNDTTIATTAAINDRIIDLVDEVGGFVPIADESKFPATNPDINSAAGTIVSIGVLSTSYTSSGSGVITIPANTLDNLSNDLTITGAANSTTYGPNFGMLVETKALSDSAYAAAPSYTFHRLTPKATEVTTLAGKATEMGLLGTAAVVEDMGILGTTDCVADMALLGTAAVVEDLNILGTADVVSDLNTLGTPDIVSDLDTCATNITNINNVGGSIANVNNCATNIADINHYGDTYQIATSAPTARADSSSLATGDLWFDSSSNKSMMVYDGSSGDGYSAMTPAQSVLDDISIVSGSLTRQEDLGLITDSISSGSGTGSLDTCATNITNINTFANVYRIASSAPSSSLDEGDLWYDSTGNTLKYYNGTGWVVTAAAGLSEILEDTSPELGGHLDCNDKNLTEVATISGDNLQIDFGSIA